MMQDKMIDEIQELKPSGYTFKENCDTLRQRHTKAPTDKTIRKYYNMDSAPADNHVKVRFLSRNRSPLALIEERAMLKHRPSITTPGPLCGTRNGWMGPPPDYLPSSPTRHTGDRR